MAWTRNDGMTKPFSVTVTSMSKMPRKPISGCTNMGKAPSKSPWRATALMTARIRLTPRATKLSARATMMSGSSMAALPHQQDDAEAGQQARRHQQNRNVSQAQAGHGRFHDADRDGHRQHAGDE